MIDREKLRHRARLSFRDGQGSARGNQMIVIAYAGREVAEKVPLSPASLASTIERMLDLLAAHVAAEISAVAVNDQVSE